MKKIFFFLLLTLASGKVAAHRSGNFFYLDNVEKHVYEDENARIFLYPSENGQVCVLVNNKSDKIIYVDKGTSFFYYRRGIADNMYQSVSTMSGTMESSGVSLNLGGFLGAFGLGGPVASALSCLSVSNSYGSFAGTIVSEKRIVPIAPNTTEVVYVSKFSISEMLENIYLLIDHKKRMKWLSHARLIENGQKQKLRRGFEREYDESNSILPFKATMNYSFSEDMGEKKEVQIDNYLKAIVTDRYKGVKNYEQTNLKYCSKYKNSPQDYTLFQKWRDGTEDSDIYFAYSLLGVLLLVLLVR